MKTEISWKLSLDNVILTIANNHTNVYREWRGQPQKNIENCVTKHPASLYTLDCLRAHLEQDRKGNKSSYLLKGISSHQVYPLIIEKNIVSSLINSLLEKVNSKFKLLVFVSSFMLTMAYGKWVCYNSATSF